MYAVTFSPSISSDSVGHGVGVGSNDDVGVGVGLGVGVAVGADAIYFRLSLTKLTFSPVDSLSIFAVPRISQYPIIV